MTTVTQFHDPMVAFKAIQPEAIALSDIGQYPVFDTWDLIQNQVLNADGSVRSRHILDSSLDDANTVHVRVWVTDSYRQAMKGKSVQLEAFDPKTGELGANLRPQSNDPRRSPVVRTDPKGTVQIYELVGDDENELLVKFTYPRAAETFHPEKGVKGCVLKF